MPESADGRVAVYIDFDNIVISRYDRVHGRSQYQRDRSRASADGAGASDGEWASRLAAASVDVGAIIDFASSFGTLVLTRAYADWSSPVNAGYRGQLVGRAIDLVQLFPAAAYAKNGADIRLAVDAVEDMFRLPDLTHVVIVGGDSDYIALAQRCKRLGRYVVGIGVAGSTSRALAAACDELVTYDALPGVARTATLDAAAHSEPAEPPRAEPPAERRSRRARPSADAPPPGPDADADADSDSEEIDLEELDLDELELDEQGEATLVLERALRLGHEKDDAEWLHSSAVKTQMKRIDPSFSERALGYRSFSEFIKSRPEIAELDESSTARLVRLSPARARQD